MSATGAVERAGLTWIGAEHYPTPADFLAEADVQGISRRIKGPPKGFVAGETWLLLAHPQTPIALKKLAEFEHAWLEREVEAGRREEPADGRAIMPAIFRIICPDAIEYVVRQDDDDERLAALAERGVRLVRVERAPEPTPLFDKAEAAMTPEDAL